MFDQTQKAGIGDLFRQDSKHTGMVERLEALLDVSLQKPMGSCPCLFDLAEGGVTSTMRSEPMRPFTEIVVRSRLQAGCE